MKTKLTALALIAATALTVLPKPAQAGDKEWAVVGGLIGGIIIGSVIADHHSNNNDYDGCSSRCGDRCEHRGYWKTQEVRVWVPGRWNTRCEHGRRVRIYISGHYECRTERIWVAYENRSHERRNYRHSRHDRDYAYNGNSCR